MSDGIPDLPSKEEVYGIHKESNNVLYNQVLQNNDDDSNIHINNPQGKIPLNYYYQRNTFNRNQNKKNNDINNENSLSIIRSSISAAPIDDRQSKISKSMNINYNINYNQNEQLNINENNKSIHGITPKNMNDNVEKYDKPDNNSSKTNQCVVIVKKVNEENEIKENKFKTIFYLILFYLSSVTNNVILHFIVSIVEKIRGLSK